MLEEIFRALENGATLITASRRLSRVLTREFHGSETARGRRVWNRPNILPLEAFLDRAWSDWLWRSTTGDAPLRLNTAQEEALWQRIIRESPQGASLLQIPETARQAAHTWQLIIAYRLTVDGSFEASDDTAAFAAWSRQFRGLCHTNGWLESARLSDFLSDRFVAGELPRPSQLYVAGFDEMTPQQADFLKAVGSWQALEIRDQPSNIDRRKLGDSSGEIRAAAVWARSLLESDPSAQIGVIVVPDLTRSRSAIERMFRQTLDRAAHLSVGPALNEYPLVRTALLMLEFAQGALPLSRAGMLLRSPFLGGAEAEQSKRALVDVKLRKKSLWDISIPLLIEAAGGCPKLQVVLRRVEKRLQDVHAVQAPSEWSKDVAGLLGAFGWPGDRTQSSGEFQTMEAWRDLLSTLASLDLTTSSMNLVQVIDWLYEATADTRFQMEDEGATVQVMGMLEAAGLRFDHLWIMGLHDEALPASANLNPFIPVAMQRQHNLPHCSAARELEFAGTVLARLFQSAPDIVLSYPEREGDRTLAPSPLVAGGWGLGADDEASSDVRTKVVFEEIADDNGPELVQANSTGGASLFRDMSACPFRAFAKHRLGAWPMEDPDLGLSYRDRGTTVHKALEVIWHELGSQARLLDLAPQDLEELIARGADAAVTKLGPGIGRDLEKRRLQKLLREWLEIEMSRAEFAVAAIEAERVATISGVQVKIRTDRVDELPDGRELILDYKTGNVTPKGWDGDRPSEPQLPLYCVTNERPIAGAAFAAIRIGEVGFRGLTAAGTTLPRMKQYSKSPLPFEARREEWRAAIEKLASNFRNGLAQVDPKPDACDFCGLRAFCRIRERS
jgi:ATP-dependent helicase/nuclease subunit B